MNVPSGRQKEKVSKQLNSSYSVSIEGPKIPVMKSKDTEEYRVAGSKWAYSISHFLVL